MSSEDCGWVFDSLIGFLQGPVWSAPILTFIEEKSAIFDAEYGVDNEEEYQKVHEDYKNLVDMILGSLMEDLGITPEQFEQACNQPPPDGALPHFHKSLFEQVWAANDYQIFRRMMLQKNVEMQLQTMEMIRQQTGAIPECCRPDGESFAALEDAFAADEARILDEVLRRSLEEAQRSETDADTLQLQQQVAAPREMQRLREEVQRERRRLDSALQHTLEPEYVPPAAEEEPEDTATPEEPQEEAPPEDAEALAQRRAYLQAQRDRLLALKKSERERALRGGGEGAAGAAGAGEGAGAGAGAGAARPRSAQAAAQRALEGHARPVSARTLAVRKALAERLKAEVVGSM